MSTPNRNGKAAHRPLSECGQLLTGGTPSRSNLNYWGGDVPWISAKSLKQFEVVDSEERLTAAGAQSHTTLVPAGSVLFVVRGMSLANEFRVGVTQRPVTFNQDLRALIPSKDIDARYLGRFLQASQTTVLGLADEASHGTKRLTSDRLAALQVPVPSLPEQRRIAEVLDRAESLRAKRRAALAKLDTLSQAIFTDMFGDPHNMGWEETELQHVAEMLTGYPFSSEGYVTNGEAVKLCRGANVLPGRIDWTDLAGWPKVDAQEFAQFALRPGDVVLAMDRPWISEGFKVAQISLSDCPALLVQRVARLRGKDGVPNEFLYHSLLQPSFTRHCRPTETTVPHISPKEIRTFAIHLPPLPLQREFARRVAAVEQLRSAHRASLVRLDALFASLQHRAFRGEL